jgi:hypothetical protein
MTIRTRRALILALAIILVSASAAWTRPAAPRADSNRQGQTTPTAVPLQFPTGTPTPGPPTETPTRTPTSTGRPLVEAISDPTNIRAEPDINGAKVGQIYIGTQYTVLGKRFQWYWIEVPEIPGGKAWVHESVVTLYGEASEIPILDELPASDPGLLSAQETALAISATPGGAATLTAQALITPTGLFTAAPADATLLPGQSLPTFTVPPFSPTPIVFPRTNPAPAQSGGLAPIVPILALGALGLMGLLVALLRRL